MKAVVTVRPGTESPFALQDLPTPEPGPGEVVVRLHAAAINHRESYIFVPRERPNFRPFVQGSDGAGTIAGLGAGVTGWQVGDAVVINSVVNCGECEGCRSGEGRCTNYELLGAPGLNGTFAQYVKVPAANLAVKPAHLTFEQTAALPMALATAWHMVMTQTALRPGETVLIHGIGSGVALYALQLAVRMGARVIVTSGSDEKLARAKELGAYAGINYRSEDVAKRVLELTAGRGADVVLDGTGKDTLPISAEAAAYAGRIAFYGGTTGYVAEKLDLWPYLAKELKLVGVSMSSRQEFADAMRFVSQTGLEPVISAVYPLEQIDAAFGEMRRAGQFGKLVLRID